MNLNIIEPNYFKEFHCIGGKCRNTCCQGWDILLSKKEYINTKNVKKPKELQDICEHAFKRIKKSDNSVIYAKMQLNEDGYCQFLDDDGLCMLQKECGYNILSTTCKQFPRVNYQYMATAESYLSTGCEEVVRILMKLENGIELTSGGEIEHKKFTNHVFAMVDKNMLATSPYKYYWDIKTLLISIMKNRNYSVEDRLILLGIAFKHIDELVKSDNGDKIPSYVDGLIAACSADSSMLDDINNIESKTHENILNFANMLLALSNSKSITTAFYEKIKSAFGIEFEIENEIQTINFYADIDKVEKQLGLFFNMLAGREYIIENLVLNSMLNMNFPFTNSELSFWDSYIFTCISYNLMIFLIAGNLSESSNDNDIIESVVYFSRCLFHNKKLADNIIDTIKKNDFSSLGAMVSLIKF